MTHKDLKHKVRWFSAAVSSLRSEFTSSVLCQVAKKADFDSSLRASKVTAYEHYAVTWAQQRVRRR